VVLLDASGRRVGERFASVSFIYDRRTAP
jgi:hypothetical protein